MKKILAIVISLIISIQSAYAQTVENDLAGLGMAPELASYIAGILPAGSVLGNNTYLKARNQANSADISILKVDTSDDTILNADTGDVIGLAIAGTTEVTVRNDELEFSATGKIDATTSVALAISDTAELTLTNDTLTFSGAAASIVGGATSLTVGSSASTIIKADADAQRLFTFDAAGDDDLYIGFGDGGTTSLQQLSISPLTSAADDDGVLYLCGGGGPGVLCAASTRGAWIGVQGEEYGGDVVISSAATAGDDVKIQPTDDFIVETQAGADTFVIDLTTGAATLDFNLATNRTIGIQEATAGTACSGTLTANGATPVVTSTTCATTGSRIFLQRTSAETGVTEAYISAITNATSFAITGEAGDTGTYNWIIFHEAP